MTLLDRHIKSQDDARALQDDTDSLQVLEKEWQKCCQIWGHQDNHQEKPDHLPISEISHTRRLSRQLTRPSILELPSHQTYLGNATLTTSPKRQHNPSFPRSKHPLKPTRGQSLQHLVHVIPSVGYASSVWSSASDSHTNQREMVQERAARFVRNDYARLSSVRRDSNLPTLDHSTEKTGHGKGHHALQDQT